MLRDWADRVDHVDMTDWKQRNRVLPWRSAQELMQSWVLLGEVEHLRQLQINELGQLGLELVIWAQEAETDLLDQGQVLE